MAARLRAVVWAASARDALDEVIAYIAEDSPQAAVHVLDAALASAASLATLSARGRIVPELNDPNIREIFVFRYRLMYRVEDGRVVVVAFLHGARDFATWRQSQSSL
jgi:plasmid stabilization system protein ParE